MTAATIVRFRAEATDSLEPTFAYATADMRCRSKYTLQMPLIRVST
jgi:hypothetical protein